MGRVGETLDCRQTVGPTVQTGKEITVQQRFKSSNSVVMESVKYA